MASRHSVPGALILLLLALPMASAFAQREQTIIREIKYEGLFRTRENLIKYKIKSEVGKQLSHETIVEDQKRLIETGYFQNVAIKTEPVEGGIKLIFSFKEKPILHDVIIRGNRKIKRKKLLDKIFDKIARGEIYDELEFYDAVLEIEKLYRKKGYYNVAVDSRREVDIKRNQVTVEVIIDEGEHGFIKQITLIGCESIEKKKVLKTMQTKRRKPIAWLLGKGELKLDVLEDDKGRIKKVYQDNGFLDARVVKMEREPFEKKPKYLHLKITIEEGPKYTVGVVSYQGNTIFTTEELTKKRKLKDGDVLSMKTANEERRRLTDYHTEKGYIQTGVVMQTRPTDVATVLDVIYVIKEGVRVSIGKIDISGNITTKDKVIRRELLLVPGEIYDGVKVRTSIKRLRGLNYFRTVDIYPIETDKEDVRDLIVEIEEKNTGQLIFGAGFSSIDQLVGQFEIAQSNFDLKDWPGLKGGGQKARLKATFGSERQDYLLSFTEPWMFNRKLSFGFDIFKQKKKYISDDYDQDAYGFRLKLNKRLFSRTRGGVTYGWRKVDIQPDEDASDLIKAEEGKRTTSSLRFDITNDTRDRYILPSRGWRRSVAFEYAGGFLGGDTDFTREEVDLVKYIPVYGRHVLRLWGRYRTMKEFGDSEGVPIFERFFIGGRTSVRGYDYREIGPKDETGEPLGGKSSLLLSAEYTFPLYENFLRGAVFYDTGNVWEDSYEFEMDELMAGWGVGLRIIIPKLGLPVNLDYSWPLNAEDDPFLVDEGRFDFSLGFTF